MKNPNIILVLIDDLGYGDVSCFTRSPLPTWSGWPSRAGGSPTAMLLLRCALPPGTP